MTLIAATVIDGICYMAADRAINIEDGSGNTYRQQMAEPKIWQSGIMLVGGAGDLAATQAIQYGTKPILALEKEAREYLLNDYSEEVKSILRAKKMLRRPWELLCSLDGRIFTVDQCGVLEVTSSWCTAGCAAMHASTALGVLSRPKGALSVKLTLAKVFNAVANVSMEVSPEFDFYAFKDGNIIEESPLQTMRRPNNRKRR